MDEEATKDLATRAFQERVLDEFAAVRREQAASTEELSAVRANQLAMHQHTTEIRTDITEIRTDITEIRTDITEIRVQQSAMAKNIGALDQRVTSLEDTVDKRLKETRPIWESVQMQLQRLSEKFDGVLMEFSELRGEFRIHGKRIAELERRIPS
ncbi:MAG: hypothetical protein ABR607_04215 [Pyrinomonadaceae bacterium]